MSAQGGLFRDEKQAFYSYGFYERKVQVARRRKRLADSGSEEFLNLRAVAESLINEVYHPDGETIRFTGPITVKNASKAIGTNLKRASRYVIRRRKRSNRLGKRGRTGFCRSKIDFTDALTSG